MFPIKSEPFDTLDAGNNSQCLRHNEDNLHASDMFNVNTCTSIAKCRPDKSLSKHVKVMMLTAAYVKNEQSTLYAFDNKGNEGHYGQNIMAINTIKTEQTEACINSTSGNIVINDIKIEKTEACINSTSGNIVDDEADMKEVLQHGLIEEHDINNTPDMSQHGRDNESQVIHVGIMADLGPHKARKVKERRYKCDYCGYSATPLRKPQEA